MEPSSLLRTRKALAGLVAGLILVLAVMAGRGLFDTWGFDVHGYVGNGVFALLVVNAVLAVVDRAPRSAVALSVVLVALSFAQVGLGYVGRETLEAAAWHVPNGVLLMALSTFQWADLRTRAAVAAAA